MAGRSVSHSEDWWATQKPAHVTRCTSNLKSGGRCRREAAPGAPVCNRHGAQLPVVQQAAATRIGMSLDDAVKRLREMLDDGSVEARDKIKILHDLLDRGGLSATSKVVVGVGAVDPVETLFRDILSDPNALAPAQPTTPALPAGDSRPATFSDAGDDPAWEDVVGREIGSDDAEDVVDAEVVEDRSDDDPHWIVVTGTKSDRPPTKRLRDDLERLRRAGLW